MPLVRSLVEREVVPSTSDLARDLLLDGGVVDLPLLVLADRQTAGRGRGRHTWWSDPGSLTFTLAFDPVAHGLRPEHEPRLALAAAVAIVEAVGSAVPLASPLGIRWPNDVESAGRKLAGILPERVGPLLLVGIGLNVRSSLDDAPEEVRRMATSVEALRRDRSARPEPRQLLAPLLARLEAVLDDLARDDPALAGRWAALDALVGQAVRIDLGPRVVRGLGLGIDPTGGLSLATEEGTIVLHGGRVLRE